MDNVDMPRRMNPYRGSRYSESRRPLKTYQLRPPEYHIDMDVLLHQFVEYEVKFAGRIPEVPADVDVTNRTEVLRIIDRGKMEKVISQHVETTQDAIISLCKSNLKLSYRDNMETLIMRIPTHEIAAICYIRDDGLNLLAIKHGNPEKCGLAVLYCETQMLAECICSLVEQCFQLIYTDATLILLEETIIKAKDQTSTSNNSTESPTTTIRRENPSFMSRSQHDLQKIANSRGKRTESSANSEASVQSSVQAELVKACLGELPSIFTLEELTQFSTLLKNINEPTMQQFHEFCDSMYRLYGPERQHKLAGLSPFIPESKYPYFAEFLKKHGIQIPENGHGTLSSRHSYPRIYTRSISDISTTNDQSDLDSVLDNISTQLAQIDHNIGDVKPYLYQ